MDASQSRPKNQLIELALLFLRLGVLGFGGPAAHIAMMEDEVVRRRRWLTREDFVDLLGATNLIPGPNSTEMAIHIGHRRAGWRGLLIAGACFILPAALITGALGWAYMRFGTLPEARWILYGVKPVIIAVVAQALWALGRTAVKTWILGALGLVAFGANLAGGDELVILGIAGVIAIVLGRKSDPKGAAAVIVPGLATVTGGGLVAAASSVSLGTLFLTFAKIGSVLFGSGYVLLAFLRADLVVERQWLTEQQLLDAIVVGQVTPGPVFTTATFIGYIIRGGPGALVATLGIFLPAFVFVAMSGPLVPRLRRSPIASAFLDGVNVASLGLMAAVSVRLSATALIDVPAVVMAVASALLLLRFKVSSAWLVLGGAAAGGVLHSLR